MLKAPKKRILTWTAVRYLAEKLTQTILTDFPCLRKQTNVKVYGVPTGGYHVAHLIVAELRRRRPKGQHDSIEITNNLKEADIVVDDLVDSGATHDRVLAEWRLHSEGAFFPFFCLINKQADKISDWIVFPWEKSSESSITDNITRILQYIGEDVTREGLRDTPKRVAKAYGELFCGYNQKPEDFMTTFDAEACDEMVLLRNIEFTSFCEHHMLPFMGFAHVAYIPNKRVIGISKLARLVDMYAKRLQIQERIGTQITLALDQYLLPVGSACVIQSKHTCMTCRGVGKQNSEMVTSSLSGVFLRKPEARAEFMSLIPRS